MTRKDYVALAAIEQDSDGYWAYYVKGWKSATDPVGALHSDLEDTRAEINRRVREAIRCTCAACRAEVVEG